MGLSSCPAPTCSAEAKELRRCPVFLHSYLPSRRKGIAVHPGSSPLTALQETEYPATSVHLRLMRSLINSNCHPGTEFTPPFHVSLLKPFSSSTPGPTEPDEPSSLEILDQPSVYQVRDILDSRRRGGLST